MGKITLILGLLFVLLLNTVHTATDDVWSECNLMHSDIEETIDYESIEHAPFFEPAGTINKYFVLQLFGMGMDNIDYSIKLKEIDTTKNKRFPEASQLINNSREDYNNAMENYYAFKSSISLLTDLSHIITDVCNVYLELNDTENYETCMNNTDLFMYYVNNAHLSSCLEPFQNKGLARIDMSSEPERNKIINETFSCFEATSLGMQDTFQMYTEDYVFESIYTTSSLYASSYRNMSLAVQNAVAAYNLLHSSNIEKINELKKRGVLSDKYNPEIRSDFEDAIRPVISMSLNPSCHRDADAGRKYDNVFYSSVVYNAAVKGGNTFPSFYDIYLPQSFFSDQRSFFGECGFDIFCYYRQNIQKRKNNYLEARMDFLETAFPLILSRVILYDLVSDHGLIQRELETYDALIKIEKRMDDEDALLMQKTASCSNELTKKLNYLDQDKISIINIEDYINSGIVSYWEGYEVTNYKHKIKQFHDTVEQINKKSSTAENILLSDDNSYALRYELFSEALLLCTQTSGEITQTSANAHHDIELLEDYTIALVRDCEIYPQNPVSQALNNIARQKCKQAGDKLKLAQAQNNSGNRFVLLKQANELALQSIILYENNISEKNVLQYNYLIQNYEDYITCAEKDGVPKSIINMHKVYLQTYKDCAQGNTNALNCLHLPDNIKNHITLLQQNEKQANTDIIDKYFSLQTEFANARVNEYVPLSVSSEFTKLSIYFSDSENDLKYEYFFCNADNIRNKLSQLEAQWRASKTSTLEQILSSTAEVHITGPSPHLDKKTCTNITITVYNPTEISGENVTFLMNKNLDILESDITSKSLEIKYVSTSSKGVSIELQKVEPFSKYSLTAQRCAVMLWSVSKKEIFDYISPSQGQGSVTLRFKAAEIPLESARLFVAVPSQSEIKSARYNGQDIGCQVLSNGIDTDNCDCSDCAYFSFTVNDKTSNSLYFETIFPSPISIRIENLTVSNLSSETIVDYDLVVSDAIYKFTDTKIALNDAADKDVASFSVTDQFGNELLKTKKFTNKGLLYSFTANQILPGKSYVYHVNYKIDKIEQYVFELSNELSPLVSVYGSDKQKEKFALAENYISQNDFAKAAKELIKLKAELDNVVARENNAKKLYDAELSIVKDKLNQKQNLSNFLQDNGFEKVSVLDTVAPQFIVMEQQYSAGNYTGALSLLRSVSAKLNFDDNEYVSLLVQNILNDYESSKEKYYSMEIKNITADNLIKQVTKTERELRAGTDFEKMSEFKNNVGQFVLLVNEIEQEHETVLLAEIEQFRSDTIYLTRFKEDYKVWYESTKNQKTVGGAPLFTFAVSASELDKVVSKAQTLLSKIDKNSNPKQTWKKARTERNTFYQKFNTSKNTAGLLQNMSTVYLDSGRQSAEICAALVTEKNLGQYSDDVDKINELLDSGEQYLASGDYGRALVYSYTGMAAAEALTDNITENEKQTSLSTQTIVIAIATLVLALIVLFFVFGGNRKNLSNQNKDETQTKYMKKLSKIK